MKTIFSKAVLALALLCSLSVKAANPTLTNFNARHFIVDPTAAPTNVITLHLDSSQFDSTATSITLTNLGNSTGVTNIFNTVFVTNVTYTSNLFVTNIDARTIISTNLFVTNLFVTYEVVSNVVAGNIQGTPPHIAMFRPDNFSVADSIVTQNADTNGVTVNGTGFGSITLGGSSSGQSIIWGDGGTNVLYRSGDNLVYTNGFGNVDFVVINGAGKEAHFGASGGGYALVQSVGGGGVTMLQNTHEIDFINTIFAPPNSDVALGSSTASWTDLFLKGNAYIKSATVTNNIGAILSVGDTTFVNMQKATQTNQLSGALTFAHATNGTDLVEWTHRRYLFNPSGANRLITLPAGWHNISGATFTVTNSTMARLDVTSWGDTSSSALQTNVSSVVTFMP